MNGPQALRHILDALKIKNMPSGIGLIDGVCNKVVFSQVDKFKFEIDSQSLGEDLRNKFKKQRISLSVISAVSKTERIKFVFASKANVYEVLTLDNFNKNYMDVMLNLVQL